MKIMISDRCKSSSVLTGPKNQRPEKDCLKDMHCRGTEQAPKNASFV